jgi:hypothetical protein
LSGTWADTSVISHGYGFHFSAEFDIFSNVNSVLNDFHGVDERFLSPSRRIRRLCLRIRLSCLVALDVFVPPGCSKDLCWKVNRCASWNYK